MSIDIQDKITKRTVRELFSEDFYCIPIYQRNYAWSMEEVSQLISDVHIASTKKQDGNYYIGNLIVDRDMNGVYETIDGQQRLTSLFIILCALKHTGMLAGESFFDTIRLDFAHRANSKASLEAIFQGVAASFKKKEIDSDKYELHILDIFNSTIKELEKLGRTPGVDMNRFISFFLDKVVILRIGVPKGINKNHYFEVMNSRGVQLEQHEIVKAAMMSKLADAKEWKAFDIIWNACADMDRFVQMNIADTRCRSVVFGDEWTDYPEDNFRTIVERFYTECKNKDNDIREKSLRQMIDHFNEGKPNPYQMDALSKTLPEDHFYSIITFPAFLLHVLKIYRPKEDVPLYDKALVDTFSDILEREDSPKRFVKGFIISLLKCRFLLDTFILRRNNKDEWGIFRMASSRDPRGQRHAYSRNTFGNESVMESTDLLMVLSMFHFSTPAMNYKNWLNGALTYLYGCTSPSCPEPDYGEYLDYMKRLAKAYMLDWYFCENAPIDFMTMIHKNKGVPQHTLVEDEGTMKHYLNTKGTDVDAFVFNFYDYLLWREKKGKSTFRFTYRTSVEHFYPQHPTPPHVTLEQDGPYLNSFGNLCLITTSMNSKFLNRLPAAKYVEYGTDEKVRELSLKLQEMLDVVKHSKKPKGQEWFTEEIEKAETQAIQRFQKYLGNPNEL